MTGDKVAVLLFAILVTLSYISAAPEAEEHTRHKRSLVTCDFFTEAGVSCTSCHEVRACYPFNIGTVTTCGGLFPYCRNGHCSAFKGALCSNTTSSSTSTTTSSTTTTEVANT